MHRLELWRYQRAQYGEQLITPNASTLGPIAPPTSSTSESESESESGETETRSPTPEPEPNSGSVGVNQPQLEFGASEDALPGLASDVWGSLPYSDGPSVDILPTEPANIFTIIPSDRNDPAFRPDYTSTPNDSAVPSTDPRFLHQPADTSGTISLGHASRELNAEPTFSGSGSGGAVLGFIPRPAICKDASDNSETIAILLQWIDQLKQTLESQHRNSGCELCYGGIY